MSAFLVGKQTIDRILSFVSFECRKSEFFKRQLTKDLHVDFSDYSWRDKLGQKMWELNQLALGYRYGEEEEALRYSFFDVSASVSRIQMFKSLKCWLYQCAEGEIPEKSILYKVFSREVALYLALRIVEETPDYDKAEWG
jgi:hypothetical protein